MIIRSLRDCLAEVASAGATSAGNISATNAPKGRERSSVKRRKKKAHTKDGIIRA